MKVTTDILMQKKKSGDKITVLTCYDYPTAVWQDSCGVDIVFVGDSVGTNILGYSSEKEVTVEDMAHHLRAVKRGIDSAYLLVDLPYNSYESEKSALKNASYLISLGADGVKLEGFKPDIVSYLVSHGIDVCSHLGLTPQFHDQKRFKVTTAVDAMKLIDQSMKLQESGAWSIVYELVPEEVARESSIRLTIPTIGIGAGRFTDGQVLVITDMLGINDLDFRHVTKFVDLKTQSIRAIEQYVSSVTSGYFPGESNIKHLSDLENQSFKKMLLGCKPMDKIE